MFDASSLSIMSKWVITQLAECEYSDAVSMNICLDERIALGLQIA